MPIKIIVNSVMAKDLFGQEYLHNLNNKTVEGAESIAATNKEAVEISFCDDMIDAAANFLEKCLKKTGRFDHALQPNDFDLLIQELRSNNEKTRNDTFRLISCLTNAENAPTIPPKIKSELLSYRVEQDKRRSLGLALYDATNMATKGDDDNQDKVVVESSTGNYFVSPFMDVIRQDLKQPTPLSTHLKHKIEPLFALGNRGAVVYRRLEPPREIFLRYPIGVEFKEEQEAMIRHVRQASRDPNLLMALLAVKHRNGTVDIDVELADCGPLNAIIPYFHGEDRLYAAMSIIKQILMGLRYLQEVADTGHHHVRPHSIFLSYDGCVKMDIPDLWDNASLVKNFEYFTLLPYTPPELRTFLISDYFNNSERDYLLQELADQERSGPRREGLTGLIQKIQSADNREGVMLTAKEILLLDTLLDSNKPNSAALKEKLTALKTEWASNYRRGTLEKNRTSQETISIGGKADSWAVGVLIYAIVTGKTLQPRREPERVGAAAVSLTPEQEQEKQEDQRAYEGEVAEFNAFVDTLCNTPVEERENLLRRTIPDDFLRHMLIRCLETDPMRRATISEAHALCYVFAGVTQEAHDWIKHGCKPLDQSSDVKTAVDAAKEMVSKSRESSARPTNAVFFREAGEAADASIPGPPPEVIAPASAALQLEAGANIVVMPDILRTDGHKHPHPLALGVLAFEELLEVVDVPGPRMARLRSHNPPNPLPNNGLTNIHYEQRRLIEGAFMRRNKRWKEVRETEVNGVSKKSLTDKLGREVERRQAENASGFLKFAVKRAAKEKTSSKAITNKTASAQQPGDAARGGFFGEQPQRESRNAGTNNDAKPRP